MTEQAAAVPAPTLQRSRGRAAFTVKADDGGPSRLADLSQHANAKLRFPAKLPGQRTVEGVMINTAGGLTGGDRLDWSVTARAQASCVVTSQACERIYDCAHQGCVTEISLDAAAGSSITWVPQETMLFDGAQLTRSLRAEIAGDGRLALFDAVILGREHMGEALTRFAFRDSWRIHRDGVLLLADETRLDVEHVGVALGAGNRVFGSFVLCTPMDESEAAELAARLRARVDDLDNRVHIGVSARAGLLTGRFVAPNAYVMRKALKPVLAQLCGPGGLPVIWRT